MRTHTISGGGRREEGGGGRKGEKDRDIATACLQYINREAQSGSKVSYMCEVVVVIYLSSGLGCRAAP